MNSQKVVNLEIDKMTCYIQALLPSSLGLFLLLVEYALIDHKILIKKSSLNRT